MKKLILFTLLVLLLIIVRANDGKRSGFFNEDSNIQPSQQGKQCVNDPSIAVTVTAYSADEDQCDEDPFITAFDTPVREGTIAVSRDLEEDLGWREGDKIHINGLGTFVVNDRMAPRWKKRVDIFFYDEDRAVSFGVKQAKAIKLAPPQEKKV